jgi:hypothetical protein
MVGKAFLAVITIFLLLGAFSTPIINGVKNWRTDGGGTTQTELVATAAAVTSANVTLDKDLYQAITSSITSITSTDGADTPVAIAYDEDTKVLNIGGLNDDANRTLTIIFDGETDDSVMRVLGPFLAVLIIGSLVGVIIWGVFEKKKRYG